MSAFLRNLVLRGAGLEAGPVPRRLPEPAEPWKRPLEATGEGGAVHPVHEVHAVHSPPP